MKGTKLRDMETPMVLGYELDRKTLTPVRRAIFGPPVFPHPSAEDYALLKEHGKKGLEKMGFYGVLDRLDHDPIFD